MPLAADMILVLDDCRRQLERLHKLAAEFRAANEVSRQFLTGAYRINAQEPVQGSSAPKFNPEIWRQRAEQARDLADQTGEPVAKTALLEIAERYDRLCR